MLLDIALFSILPPESGETTRSSRIHYDNNRLSETNFPFMITTKLGRKIIVEMGNSNRASEDGVFAGRRTAACRVAQASS